MERKRQKLVGWDKGSLTEQQTEGTGTTTIQMRRKHNTNRTTHRAALPDRTASVPSQAASEFPPPCSPPTGTQHDGTWCGIPGSVWPGGVSPSGCAPSWIPMKINPVLAKPRTVVISFVLLDLDLLLVAVPVGLLSGHLSGSLKG